MSVHKLIIPKITYNKKIKYYVYRSTNADDINTISKVSKLQPVMIVDPDECVEKTISRRHCYVVYDAETSEGLNDYGVTYNGPSPNLLPTYEYESDINLIQLNTYTYVNELVLKPVELHYKDGIVFYYSVIGVLEEDNCVTHISKVNGVLIEYLQDSELNRELWACNDFQDNENDEWYKVQNIAYNETDNTIKIGNVTRPNDITLRGYPIVEEVPSIPEDGIHVSLNSLISNTFMTLEVLNPWRENNQEFNYRKLKSFKIRNTAGNHYSDFSIPTYQSLVPVSIEKMIILMRVNPASLTPARYDHDLDTVKRFEVIRRDGIYYNRKEHKALGYNKWSIPLENNELSVFSETSIQNTINIQISGIIGNIYVFDIYLVDVYENVSPVTQYVLET